MQKTNLTVSVLFAAVLFCALTGCATQSAGKVQSSQHPAPSSQDTSISPKNGNDTGLTADEEALFKEDEDEWLDEDDTQKLALIADPIEPFNRAMFSFNDKLYTWVLRPVTLGYRKVAPEPVRLGVRNFFTNLATPIRFTNCLLQGKGKAATVEATKLIFNSTFGLLGFIDIFEDRPEMQPDKEDFGQTLGRWGVGSGFYIVWPILGSSDLRDTVGLAGDTVLDPLTYVDNTKVALSLRGYERINRLSFHIEDIDAAKKAAFDPYEATRNFYIQLRQSKIKK
jgi:phospholipid-binding lipoprotein MlaA